MKYIMGILLSVLFYACTDILDKKDLSSVTDKSVWSDSKYALAYLDRLYNENLPEWDYTLADYSDESDGTNCALGADAVMFGQLTSNSIDKWNYNNIRNINILFDNVQSGSIEEDQKKSLKAQASVLRAWKYFEMVRLYGGIPIIKTAQKLTDDIYPERNKTSECIDFIIEDLNYAIDNLPWHWSNKDEGRVTKATAYALKGRVLLYYASPQFNPSHNDERWQKAYIANKEALDSISSNGYGLYNSYENIWFDEMNKEDLFVKRYEEPSIINQWEAATRPLTEAQFVSGYNQPTWDLVTSYPMISGVSIDNKDSGYDSIFYWKNRDPRFKATIAYNGCLWELSGKKGRKQWTGVINPNNTGFYCKKACNVDYSIYYTTRSSTDWVEIRFAEVMLNYAETAAECNKIQEAYNMIIEIRKRAGIFPGKNNMYGLEQNMDRSKMIDAIMLERKIEFAFESKRYWDLRRRRLFQSELNGKKRHGIYSKLIIPQDIFYKNEASINIDLEYNKYFKDSVILVDNKYFINFPNEYYFYGIPNKHLETNSKIKQTQGWNDGSFNPLD